MKMLAKVCGLVHPEDAAFAAAQGADLLGFVSHPPSPRHCPDLSVAQPFRDRAVLVMVAPCGQAVLDSAQRFGFHWVQPYLPREGRGAALQLLREAGLAVLLPWADEPGQEALSADLYVWEPGVAATGVLGGSGQGHAMRHPPPGPFLLAGGLEAAALSARVAALPVAARGHLRGADAASRLEAGPGRKDPLKVAAFIASVHDLEPA
jgi:phosphoribosylanthranilate isomerase